MSKNSGDPLLSHSIQELTVEMGGCGEVWKEQILGFSPFSWESGRRHPWERSRLQECGGGMDVVDPFIRESMTVFNARSE